MRGRDGGERRARDMGRGEGDREKEKGKIERGGSRGE